jgi:hypothetical protein
MAVDLDMVVLLSIPSSADEGDLGRMVIGIRRQSSVSD